MEIEFKFQVPSDRLQALEKELISEGAFPTRMQALYFDTADGALAAHGISLRLRKEDAQWVQTAKATGPGLVHRLEHNVPIPVLWGELPPMDIARHNGSDVGALIERVLRDADAPLTALFGTDIRRLSCELRLDAGLVELALDVGHVMMPPVVGTQVPERVSEVCELELELIDGNVQCLVNAALDWSQQHGLWLSTLSKAGRGKRLLVAAADQHAVKASPPAYSKNAMKSASGIQIQRIVVANCLSQILPNASEVASGNEAADVVHQLRVGIRRLRTALRELAVLMPKAFDPSWDAPLADVFRVLGAQRDRTLLLNSIEPRLRRVGAPPLLMPNGEADALSLGDAVRGASFQMALVQLIGFASQDDESEANYRPPLRAIRKRLEKLHLAIQQGGEQFESLDFPEQHAVRKRLKRLRYLSEFVAPFFGNKRFKRYLERLVPAQDALGEYNDELNASSAYQEAVEDNPRAWYAIGWLSAMRPIRVEACRTYLVEFGKSPKFWK